MKRIRHVVHVGLHLLVYAVGLSMLWQFVLAPAIFAWFCWRFAALVNYPCTAPPWSTPVLFVATVLVEVALVRHAVHFIHHWRELA